MNLWFRLLILLMTSPFRPRLIAPDGVSRLKFRVWFNDLDTNGHVNNGRYWTFFDLGRTDLIMRTGLLRAAFRNKWMPIVGSGAIRFRRELKLFQSFMLETRLLAWTDSRVVIEQRVLTGKDDVVATRGLILGGFYDRRARRFVSANAIFGSIGATGAISPPLNAAAEALLRVDASLKEEVEPGVG